MENESFEGFETIEAETPAAGKMPKEKHLHWGPEEPGYQMHQTLGKAATKGLYNSLAGQLKREGFVAAWNRASSRKVRLVTCLTFDPASGKWEGLPDGWTLAREPEPEIEDEAGE